MSVRVIDPEGKVRTNKTIGGYVGRVGSTITYDLKADRGGVAEPSGWLAGIGDLVGNGGTDAQDDAMRDNCGHLVGARMGRGVVGVEQLF
jgi:hypothetical protein